MSNKIFISLLAILLLFSCKKEEISFDKPILFLNLVEQNSKETMFHIDFYNERSIENANISIKFTENVENPTFEYTQFIKQINSLTELETSVANYLIKENTEILVQAVLKQNNIVIQSNEITLQITEGVYPVIKSIEPLTVTWLDTISIAAENFNPSEENLKVYFDGNAMNKYQIINDSVIKVPIVFDIRNLNPEISIKSIDKTSNKFNINIKEPLFERNINGTIFYKDTIDLYGSHFNKEFSLIEINNQKQTILEIDTNHIQFIYNSGYQEGALSINLKFWDSNFTYPNNLNSKTFIVNYFQPDTVGFFDRFTIYGSHLNNVNKIILNNQNYDNPFSYNQYKDSINIKLTGNLYFDNNPNIRIAMYDDFNTTTFNESVTIRIPEIISIEPELITVGAKCTLYIKNHNTSYYANPYALFDEINSTQTITSSNSFNGFIVEIPENIPNPTSIKGVISGVKTKNSISINHKPVIINNINLDTLYRGAYPTIYGEGFSPNLSYNSVLFDGLLSGNYSGISNENSLYFRTYSYQNEIIKDINLSVKVGPVESNTIPVKFIEPYHHDKHFTVNCGGYSYISEQYNDLIYFGIVGWTSSPHNTTGCAYSITDEIWTFNPTNQEIKLVTEFPEEPKYSPISFIHDENLIVFASDSIWSYNLSMDVWTNLHREYNLKFNLEEEIYYRSGFLIDDDLYIMINSRLFKVDLISYSITELALLDKIVMQKGFIYNSQPYVITQNAELYKYILLTDEWVFVSIIPSESGSYNITDLWRRRPAIIKNDRLYIIGYYAHYFDFLTNTWHKSHISNKMSQVEAGNGILLNDTIYTIEVNDWDKELYFNKYLPEYDKFY